VLKGAGAVGAAGVTGVAGCLGGGGGGSRTIQQGVLLPLTGDLANLGGPIRDGATLPASELEGETEFTFDIQEEDTETNAQAGISGAETLVNNGFPAITGPASSGVNMQVTQQVLIPNETVGCSPSSTSPAVTTLDDDDFIYRTCPSDALQGQVIAQVGAEELSNSTAATMYVNNDYGQALSEVLED
jgi:ABC-type branched-subunit amino acid transport system substrate-binding protein